MRIRRLEDSPLGEQAEDDRKWLMTWLIDDPVLEQARYCIGVLGPSWELRYRYARQIEAQLLLSGVAGILENRQRRVPSDEIIAAGVRGALKAYQAILSQKPGATQGSLDRLLGKQRQGQLKSYLSSLPFIADPGRCVQNP